MTLGSNVRLLDSIQMVNNSLESIAQCMLGKGKLDTAYKTYTTSLLQKWRDEGTGWDNFKNYLARDCTLLLEILH